MANQTSGPHGPYETEAEARADAARALEVPVTRPYDANADRAARLDARRRYLADALTAAGVETGAYDREICAWLAGWEPETLAVVVGLLERAHAAGRRAACSTTADDDDTEA